MDLKCSDVNLWRESLSAYSTGINSLNKPDLVSLDEFYRLQLPTLLHARNPNPFITKSELSKLLSWKLTRGKWRPRLMSFITSLDEEMVKSTSEKAFESLPDIGKAITALTALKGIGPATASAVLAAYAPEVAPFMSDEAMEAALGSSKDYSLKQYLVLTEKLQEKAKELSTDSISFTPSDVERALWSSAVVAKSSKPASLSKPKTTTLPKSSKRKRTR